MPDLLFVLYLLVYFPLSKLWRSLHPDVSKPNRSPLQTYWRQGRHVLALLAILLLVMWLQHYSPVDLGLALPRSRVAMAGLATACCFLIGLHLVEKRIERTMAPEKRAGHEAQLRAMPMAVPRTAPETTAYLITMVGMTAMWEVLYRGYLLLVLTPLTGMPAAIALAAVAYGAGHGYKNPRQFIGSIVAAFAFTIGYALTGSLWWLIVLHAAAPVGLLLAMKKVDADKPARTTDLAAKSDPAASWTPVRRQ